MAKFKENYEKDVHCRIGSLESDKVQILGAMDVHCRIGSLEMLGKDISFSVIRSE